MADRELRIKIKVDGKDTTAVLRLTDQELKEIQASARSAGSALEEAMKESLDEISKAGKELRKAAGELNKFGNEAGGASKKVKRTGDASGQATQLLFGLGDAANDARYGIDALGNNFALTAEQAGDIIMQTGRVRGAMSALSTAVVGPAGVVLAIQGLIALGPEIADFFSGSSAAAEKFEKTVKDAAEGMFDIAEDIGSFEAATLQQAQQVADRLQGYISNIEDQQDDYNTIVEALEAENEASGPGMAGAQAFEMQFAQERLDMQNLTLERARQIRDQRAEELLYQKAALSVVEQKIKQLEVEARLAEEFERATARRADEGDETPEVDRSALRAAMFERRALEIEAMEDSFQKTLAQIDLEVDRQIEAYREKYREQYPLLYEELRRLLEEQRDQLKEDALAAPIPLATIDPPELQDAQVDFGPLSFDAESYSEQLKGGILDSIDLIDRAIADLNQQFRQVKTQDARDEIQRMINKLREAKQEFEGTLDSDELDIGPALEGGITSAASSIAEGVGELAAGSKNAKEVGAAVLGTLADLAMRVGKLMIGFGIASLELKSLIKNPIGAIVAGGALIALGAAAKATIGGAVSSATGSQNTNSQPDRPDLEGGAEGGGRVPGFADGVTGFGGGVALVGERGPELVSLGRGSNVITNENVQRMAGFMNGAIGAAGNSFRRQNQRPNVSTNANVTINASSRSLAEMIDYDVITEIEEVQQRKRELLD